jgi:hypothetical protein
MLLPILLLKPMLRYKVSYLKPKKKGFYSNQEAIFLDPEGALMWQEHVEKEGCKNIKMEVS